MDTTTQPLELRHLIDGRWERGMGTATQSTDPARPDVAVAKYQEASEEQLEQAMRAAVRAQREWDRLGLIARGRILRRAGELLAARTDWVAALMTAEEGKTLPESRAEVEASIETFFYHGLAARQPDGATYPSTHPDEVVRTVRRPVGVVGVITPWNFPVQIPVWKIAPALLWGNTVVWKPASDTPALAVALTEVLQEAGLPDGVLNLLLGPGSLGARLVTHPTTAAITFTGSVGVGHQIRDHAVPQGKRLQMELGGHNAAIVMPDADIETAATAMVAAATGSTGQKCTATRRIIAVGAAYEPLRSALQPQVQALVVGPGDDASVGIGPLVSARAKQDVEQALELAAKEGAAVLASAPAPEGDGHFVAPVLLEGDSTMTVCREEVFGPVVTLLRARNLDEAIGIANATLYGLTASVFTRDERVVRRCLAEVDAGLIKVNSPSTGSELHAPFGGLKDSSFPAPREQNSQSAAEFFTVTKTAYLRLPTEVTEDAR